MNVYHDPNIPIEVSFNEVFMISLASVPSTGYTWKAEYDSTFVELLTSPKFVPNSLAMGSGGKELFEFVTKQSGNTQLKMKYQREWEMAPKEIKIFQVHIS